MSDLAQVAAPGSEEGKLLARIDFARLPRHVAVIMDGNGRWARRRRLPRVAGHRAGIDSVREIVETSARIGIPVLTLYAFSQENWKRPRTEIEFLMQLLREYIRKETDTLRRNNIRFQVIGRMEDLARPVRHELDLALSDTMSNTGMTFNIALSYGGRAEIVDACRAIVREGLPVESVDEAAIARHLYTAGQPDPDLLVRTSGEMRVSNFLLWQIAYAELWVTPVLWPDFRKKDLFEALLGYQSRERRYGGLGEPEAPSGAPVVVRG